jgi:hypothetical protein
MAEAAQGIEALGHWLEIKVGFAFLIFVTFFWFMVTMHGNEPELEPDVFSLEQSLQEHGMYNETLVCGFISACVGRIDGSRSANGPEMELQLAELELRLMECFKAFEDNGLTSMNMDKLLEGTQKFSEVDESFRVQECSHQEFMLTGDEPEMETWIPEDMPEEYNSMEIAPFRTALSGTYGSMDDWTLDQAFD